MTSIAPMTTALCAERVMETVPLLMRAIRRVMRRHHGDDLSMPQVRAMVVVRHHEGASLSLVAEHLNSTLSATSKLVDGLVERGYLARETAPDDRRRITLALTPTGRAMLDEAWQAGSQFIAEKLAALSPEECRMVAETMALLQGAFGHRAGR